MKVLVLFDLPRPVDPNASFTMKALREEEDRPTEADVILSLRRLGHEVDTLPVFDNVAGIVDKIRDFAPGVVFNLCESFFNDRANEPNIPALLELLKTPYTGATPEALFLCKDKALAKSILTFHRIRLPRFQVSRRLHRLRTVKKLRFPVFVKPLGQESSDGIAKASLARNESDAIERVRFIHDSLGCDAIIEEYVDGRELYISVLGSRQLTVLPPRELFFTSSDSGEPRFATVKAKWDDAYRARHGIRNGPAAALPDKVARKLSTIARRIYTLLRIRGLGRIDIRLTPEGEAVFIEANPNPSLAQGDDFAKSAAAAGLDYDQLIQLILDTARKPAR